MGMHIETSLRLRDLAKRQLRELYSTARHFGFDHDKILERRTAILEHCKLCPHWVHSYLEGYWQHIMDCAYEHDLIFGGIINGVFYSTHNDRADYYEKHGISPCDYSDDGRVIHRGHYWKESFPVSALPRPFFIDVVPRIRAGTI